MIALLSLFACGVQDTWEAPVYPAVQPGNPVVGAAEGYLKLPVGTPLGGFSTRCNCLSGQGRQDTRDSAYVNNFVPSTGVHTHPGIKVIWIENGDDHLVLTKTDSIYSYDGLVEDLERRLSEATGLDLDGKVVNATNHSHSGYGGFSDQITFYLGSDKYNEEVFQRFSSQIAEVALDAYEGRVDAKIGMTIARDWDPDDQIYSDRRGENDDLIVDPDDPFNTGKDPHLALMRFDTLEDEPIAVMVNFGMHGIVLSEQNPMVSTDSGGGIEAYLQEAFDEPVVVMFTQGSGGDQSPRGEQDDYARIESLGERATPILHEVWAATPTSSDPIAMQTVSRSLPQHQSTISVTRNGTVDWHYLPYDPDYVSDDIVFDGTSIVSPIDEFNTNNGGIFCGAGDIDIPIGVLPTDAFPYSTCLDAQTVGNLVGNFFDVDPAVYGLDPEGEQTVPLPLPDTLRAGTTSSRLGPLPIVGPDGTERLADLFLGFFPGEPTHMFNQQFRRRSKAELGYEHAVLVGYSQDHEGYLLIPEDWLVGGYEPSIAVWGPLQGEAMLEGVLAYSAELLADDVHQPQDPLNEYQPTQYPQRELPSLIPDATPEAGTRVFEGDVPETFWIPEGFTLDLTVPESVPRVQGVVQVAWRGGDPGVDSPVVGLEREVDGTWQPVTTRAGRAITDSTHDILVGYTPHPLEPLDLQQEHYWWASWQAVSHVHDRQGLPEGTYRLTVTGSHFTGTETQWPWTSEPYSFTTEPFEIAPATLSIEFDDAWLISNPAPEAGWRYIAAGGDNRGDNPAVGPFEVVWNTPTGPVTETVDGSPSGQRTALDITGPVEATSLTVTDRFGNTGTVELATP